MAERLYGPKGHRWDPTFPIGVWPPDFRSSCPTCGEGPVGPFDATATTVRVMVVLAVASLLAAPLFLFVSENTIPVALFLFIVPVVKHSLAWGSGSAENARRRWRPSPRP